MLNSKQVERRTFNIERPMLNRFAQSFLYKIDRMHYSMLDVRCSMFISFSFDYTVVWLLSSVLCLLSSTLSPQSSDLCHLPSVLNLSPLTSVICPQSSDLCFLTPALLPFRFLKLLGLIIGCQVVNEFLKVTL
jgi:hypothetical protein